MMSDRDALIVCEKFSLLVVAFHTYRSKKDVAIATATSE